MLASISSGQDESQLDLIRESPIDSDYSALALIDLTHRGDIVLDPFLGSGSTLIAAQRTGRVCRGIELDPLYVDLIVRRYEAETSNAVRLLDTGERYADLAIKRLRVAGGQSDRTLRRCP